MTKEKPVGLVFLVLADMERTVCLSHVLNGDREGIRRRASQAALDMIRRYLADKPARCVRLIPTSLV